MTCSCGRPWFINTPDEKLCLWCDAVQILSAAVSTYGLEGLEDTQ
jgi:hypothetical protein